MGEDDSMQIVDSLMISMSADHFEREAPLPSDIYMRLHADKYIQLGKRGQPCRFESLHAFQDKKLKTVFIHQKELSLLVAESLGRLSQSENSAVSVDKKMLMLSQSADVVLKQIEHLGMTTESLEATKTYTKYLRNFSKLSPSIVDMVHRFKNLPGNFVHHAMMVSSISVIIGSELGWSSESILEKLSLGGLLHDVGLLKVPKEILRKNYLEMTLEEKTIYERHPYLGAQMIRALPSVPSEVVSIAYEHHENAAGLGFPRKLEDQKINPLSKVVGLADQFSELVLPQFTNEDPFKPEQAMNYIENILGQPFNPDCFKAFKSIFAKK